MNKTYHFELNSELLDNVEGDGRIEMCTGAVNYGVPPQFGGEAGKTSPEELIMAALSACFSMTMGFTFEKRKIPVAKFAMKAEAQVDRIEKSLVLTSITLRPQIILSAESEDEKAKLQDDINAAIERSKKACLVSNALKGNVEVIVEPEFA